MLRSRLAANLGLPRSLPALVLATGLLASVAAGLQVDRMAQAADRERFNQAVAEAHLSVAARLQTYLAALRAGAALFAARRGDVTLAEFRAFAGRLDLPQVYPGIQGLGFSARMPAVGGAETRALLAEMGVGDIRIRPPEPRPEVHAIVFLEPLDRRNQAAIGYDMYSNPIRRTAMRRARDLGVSAMSGKVHLVQEIDPHKQAGFLIYHPVYRSGDVPATVAQRRAELRGFVYAPFRSDDLLRGILGERGEPRVHVTVYDQAVAPENLLHSSRGPSGSTRARFTTERQLEVAGRRWMVEYRSAPALEAGSSRSLALVTFLGGLLATGLVAAATARQVRARLLAEREIEARREVEQDRELLVAELNHRVKNTLATVQSIAAQSLRGGRSPADARQRFEARLLALSHAHDLLTREHWRGAELSEIVREELQPYAGQRVKACGPETRLPPGVALALAMALHELATNAAKYGALSGPTGRVEVTWSVSGGGDGRRLELIWRETGGPVVEPPAAPGFGARMITQGLQRQLRGEVELSFPPTGVVCRIDVPLAPEPSALAPE